jgi:hypothetical protein
MDEVNQTIIDELISAGKQQLAGPLRPFDFETGDPEAERLINDLNGHPHMFVLACVMDKQVKAGRAWIIPYIVGRELGGWDFATFRDADEATISEIFKRLKLHRFNNVMAESFSSAVHDIEAKYGGDASKVWSDPQCPKSALVIRRLLEFRGVGVKIATMITNILVRDFKIPMRECSSIDISPDVQVKKFFIANHLLREGASNEELIYRARELSPEYPSLLDLAAWEGGRILPRRKRTGNKQEVHKTDEAS